MWVHWSNKVMKFIHHGKRITLQGLKNDCVQCPIIKEVKLKGLLNRKAISHCIQVSLGEGHSETVDQELSQ